MIRPKFVVIPVSPKAKTGTQKARQYKGFGIAALVAARPLKQLHKNKPLISNPTASAPGLLSLRDLFAPPPA